MDEWARLRKEHFAVPEPTVCPQCNGEGAVTRSWCDRCVHCGQSTATPPECEGGCDVHEEARQKRRDDR
jgi:hypothetical protein